MKIWVIIISDDLIPKRYSALFEAVCKCVHDYNNNSPLSFEKNFQSILKLFTSPVSAKILYTLNHIGFSSQSELNNPKKLSLGPKVIISSIISDLELYGIIKRIEDNDTTSELIKEFWKREYPTSPYKPRFYMISSEFKPVVELYSNLFEEKYIWKRTLSEIHSRKTSWEKFTKENHQIIMKKQQIEAEQIGICEICKKPITESMDKSLYTRYDCGVFACNSCYVPKELMSKWMRKSK